MTINAYLLNMYAYHIQKGENMKVSKPSSVRFPDEIETLLRKLANKSDRSYSKEIVSRVRRTLKEDGLINA
ncbi:MAG TPA: Arc family DNA-binding protein [Arsenophonus nasoniae]|uniref:Arc family DNA-binding protein n=1 Tax=Arsenophonus nasoniae TaxID=638 RepID=UPI00387A3ABC